jgi:hypothetical protein
MLDIAVILRDTPSAFLRMRAELERLLLSGEDFS